MARAHLVDRYGIDIGEVVDEGYLDGIAGAEDVFLSEFPNMCYHLCLEHAKTALRKHGKKWSGPNENPWLRSMIEWTAFVPPLVFHAIWENLFERMHEKGHAKMVAHLIKHVFQRDENKLWTAKWRSSLVEVPPGFSTYASNAMASRWAKLDRMHPKGTDRGDVTAMFETLEKDAKVMYLDDVFKSVRHDVGGEHRFQPSLSRGEGLMSGRGGLRPKPYRRTTVHKLMAADSESSISLQFPANASWYLRPWVVPKVSAADFDADHAEIP